MRIGVVDLLIGTVVERSRNGSLWGKDKVLGLNNIHFKCSLKRQNSVKFVLTYGIIKKG
jgi:hypothetical protein